MEQLIGTGQTDWAKRLFKENPALVRLALRYIGNDTLPHPNAVGEVLGMRDLLAILLSQIEGQPAEVSTELAENLHEALPYLWNADLFLTASSIRLPPHVIGQRLPYPLMWITFDRKLKHFPGLSEPDGEDNLECVGVLLAEGTSAMGAWFVRGSMVDGTTVYARKLLLGTRYPEDCDPAWQSLMAALSFMNSPYVTQQEQPMTRRERKNLGLGRADEQEPQNVLRYIDLRAAEVHPAEHGDAHDVQWKCRWLVRCHQRAQWYPSTQSHKIIWIESFIKGPDNAPIKQEAYRVNR
jgi:hypothetical protein